MHPGQARSGVLLLALLLGNGCGKPSQVDPLPRPEEPVRLGRVGQEFLTGEGGEEALLGENQEYKPPLILESPLPVYPAGALEANAAPQVIIVKILVGKDGRVEDVLDSPRRPAAEGPFARDFRRVVEEALRQWRFTPAAICTYEPGADLNGDGASDYRIERSRVPLRVLYDVRFFFEIVDGEGMVQRPGEEGDQQ